MRSRVRLARHSALIGEFNSSPAEGTSAERLVLMRYLWLTL
jgi:hypothetical protein